MERIPAEGAPLVFIVDDEASVRRALVRLLRKSGYEVAAFAAAEDFLAAAHPSPGPSCALVDLALPGLDGLELQALMRERGLELPVVFVSGRGDVESGVRAMKEGAVDFLEKPVSHETLVRAIERALDRDQRRRSESAERAAL